jgi:4-amino-4-deoxy-L-arabinose transferase-like glycosyltransferase
MRFQLDHDWQGNMSTPRARVGDSAKTYLLLILCATWIFLGLIGHEPWKPLESTGISVVKSILDGGSLIAPVASGETTLEAPPLYYLTASASAQLLAPILDMHDGARLINIVWLTILLLMVGMSGRELWSRGVGRHAAFIMVGTIGLVTNAHSLNAEVASLASIATGFYALALSKRRPWRASALFGLALATAFLTSGFLPVIILMSSTLMLPLLFGAWRTQSFAIVVSVALLIASPFIATWLFLLHNYYPSIFFSWWQLNLSSFNQLNHQYFLRILIWYAWPALPLALLGLWRYRLHLLNKPRFQLMLVFFSCSLFFLGFAAAPNDIYALPLLLPLVALAAGSVEHLKRGAAAALNWFGVILFGLIGGLIWLGWIAMQSGHPAKIKERMQFLSGMQETSFSLSMFIIALAMTSVWMLVCLRAKQTNKSTITNWALGMTFGWGLLMTLWLPMIDSAKAYAIVFSSLHQSIPTNYQCINSLNVGQPQRLLFNYYTNIQLQAVEVRGQLDCDLYLIQDYRDAGRMQPGQDWKLIWRGKRPADRKEGFRLFQIQR